MRYETIWKFETARFVIMCDVAPEDMDPADSFQFDADIEAVRNGEVEWFCVRVQVCTKDGTQLGADYLGGCAYKSASDFVTDHRGTGGDYFTDMIREAVRQARANMGRFAAMKLRAA